MKKLTRLMLIGLPLLAFSSASFSAEDSTASGLLIKSKYKKKVLTYLNGNPSGSISSGEAYPFEYVSQKKESETFTIKDAATNNIVGKYRITVGTHSVSNVQIEDLSPDKTPDAPVVRAESGNQTVGSDGKPVEQPTLVLGDSDINLHNSSGGSGSPK